MQALRRFIVLYRLYIAIALIALGVLITMQKHGIYVSWIFFLVAIIMVIAHFMIGPITLIQKHVEDGDIEGAQALLDRVKYPNLLYKPVRSTYYTIKGNMAMMKQDFDSAEKHLKKSSELGSPMPEAEGANKLQLGMMSMQRGDLKQGESYIRAAIRAGIADKESEAVAYISMCQIFMNKREFRAAKDYFRRAKACKPTTKQVVDQIKEVEKYISRMPG